VARIELRDCIVRFKDGFGGTAKVDDTSIADEDATLEIDNVANLTNLTSIVPVGARFQIVDVQATYTVTAQNANEKQSVTIDATLGTFTLKLGATGDPSDPIDYDTDATDFLTAMLASTDFDSGDIVVTGTNPNFVVEFMGQYLNTDVDILIEDEGNLTGTVTVAVVCPGAVTWKLTFSPALEADEPPGLPVNEAVITFLPQQIEIKIGDGNITYTENRTYEYMLDRGDLDTVREGDQVPLDVRLECTYEHIVTGTSEEISPLDALKGVGGASGWVSSSADQCEPYAIDIEVEHDPPCGTAQTETTLFPDFRPDTKEVNFQDATISLTGKCNVIEPEVGRS
jgi:hypothetical protein